jgi:hypothetical protein
VALQKAIRLQLLLIDQQASRFAFLQKQDSFAWESLDMQKADKDVALKVDAVTRYFMRRLAMAQQKSRGKRMQYANALAETVFVFVVAPISGIVGVRLIASAKLHSALLTRLMNIAPDAFALTIGGLAMLFGFCILHKRMKQRMRDDPHCYLRFSTEKDAEIATIQKTCALIALGILPIGLGLLVLAM